MYSYLMVRFFYLRNVDVCFVTSFFFNSMNLNMAEFVQHVFCYLHNGIISKVTNGMHFRGLTRININFRIFSFFV